MVSGTPIRSGKTLIPLLADADSYIIPNRVETASDCTIHAERPRLSVWKLSFETDWRNCEHRSRPHNVKAKSRLSDCRSRRIFR